MIGRARFRAPPLVMIFLPPTISRLPPLNKGKVTRVDRSVFRSDRPELGRQPLYTAGCFRVGLGRLQRTNHRHATINKSIHGPNCHHHLVRSVDLYRRCWHGCFAAVASSAWGKTHFRTGGHPGLHGVCISEMVSETGAPPKDSDFGISRRLTN